jgi:hypothetical protein
LTVILNEQLGTPTKVDEHVTTFTPSGKKEFDSGVQETVLPQPIDTPGGG